MMKFFIYQISFFLQRFSALTLLWVLGATLYAQTPTKPNIKVFADTTQMRIGEQIKFGIEVEIDSTRPVSFPEQERSLGAMEIVEMNPIDTQRVDSRFRLKKEYFLTQFDSGSYVIPSFPLKISAETYFTDSLAIKVFDVPVDTLKQKMYDIKDITEVEIPSRFWRFFAYVFGVLLLLGAAGYAWWYMRRKRKEAEEDLPPYEKAVREIEALNQNVLNSQNDYKNFYTKLTDILRKYYDEELHLDLTECTTDEIIERIEALVTTNKLVLNLSNLQDLKQTLKTADLVKFARFRTDPADAAQDRDAIKAFIGHTHQAIPEPTEEEILEEARFKQRLLERRRKQRIRMAVTAAVAVVLLTMGVMTARYGFMPMVDTIIRTPGKVMLDGHWVKSEYGMPPVGIETPRVLKQVKLKLPPQTEQVIEGISNYAYGQIGSDFYVVVNHVFFKPNLDIKADQVQELTEDELKNRLGLAEFQLESQDVSLDGINGKLKTGTFFKNSKEYAFKAYTFFTQPTLRQIVIVYDKNKRYYDQISTRIVESISLKSENQPDVQ